MEFSLACIGSALACVGCALACVGSALVHIRSELVRVEFLCQGLLCGCSALVRAPTLKLACCAETCWAGGWEDGHGWGSGTRQVPKNWGR